MPNDRERDDQGRWTPETSAEEVLDAMEPLEPYGTSEIEDRLGLPHSTAHYRLNKLAEEGLVRKKKLNERTVVWVRPKPNANGEPAEVSE
jgi:DNA-binding Lrp family transcriptional regulator